MTRLVSLIFILTGLAGLLASAGGPILPQFGVSPVVAHCIEAAGHLVLAVGAIVSLFYWRQMSRSAESREWNSRARDAWSRSGPLPIGHMIGAAACILVVSAFVLASNIVPAPWKAVGMQAVPLIVLVVIWAIMMIHLRRSKRGKGEE